GSGGFAPVSAASAAAIRWVVCNACHCFSTAANSAPYRWASSAGAVGGRSPSIRAAAEPVGGAYAGGRSPSIRATNGFSGGAGAALASLVVVTGEAWIASFQGRKIGSK